MASAVDAAFLELRRTTELETRRHWLCYSVLGLLLATLGLFAIGAAAMTTLLSVVVLGWLLLFAGGFQTGAAIWRRGWEGFFVDALTGFLYMAVGAMIIASPGAAEITLTLMISAYLVANGLLRSYVALTTQYRHRLLMLFNGVVSIALGAMIWERWPISGLWVIGLFVGIDLLLNGCSLLFLAISARYRLGREA